MKTVKDALTWSGSGATLSLFVVTKLQVAPSLEMALKDCRPRQVRAYELEDEAGVLAGRHLVEYDAVFDGIPADLEGYLNAYLHEAMARGAGCAWFGFEGSFDFAYLLAPEIAEQIFALADPTGVALACDDDLRRSDVWRDRVVDARARTFGAAPRHPH